MTVIIYLSAGNILSLTLWAQACGNFQTSGSKVNSCRASAPLSSHEIDGVRKEKERLTAAPEGYNLVEEDHMLVKPFQEFFHLDGAVSY